MQGRAGAGRPPTRHTQQAHSGWPPASRTCQLAEPGLAHPHERVAGLHLLRHQRLGGRHKHHLALQAGRHHDGRGRPIREAIQRQGLILRGVGGWGRQSRGRVQSGGHGWGTRNWMGHGAAPRTHLWEPAGKVVHDHRGNQRFAQPRGQAHQRVGQQRGLQGQADKQLGGWSHPEWRECGAGAASRGSTRRWRGQCRAQQSQQRRLCGRRSSAAGAAVAAPGCRPAGTPAVKLLLETPSAAHCLCSQTGRWAGKPGRHARADGLMGDCGHFVQHGRAAQEAPAWKISDAQLLGCSGDTLRRAGGHACAGECCRWLC